MAAEPRVFRAIFFIVICISEVESKWVPAGPCDASVSTCISRKVLRRRPYGPWSKVSLLLRGSEGKSYAYILIISIYMIKSSRGMHYK